MPTPWTTIRVFISSTFRDMHAERDYLVRFVFPEVRQRCVQRRLHLVDIDLRWGVTEEEAEQGKVLGICLDEIERCRPFFIGLLGERYGWVPPEYILPDGTRYDWLRQFELNHSITAIEIYHGVLHNPSTSQRALFYFRDSSFLNDVPEDHRAIFLPENEESAKKLNQLKEEIRNHCQVFESYPCAYAGIDEDGKVVLAGLEVFGQHVLEGLWSAIDKEYPGDQKPPDELEIERTYHETFIERCSQGFIGRLEQLEQMRIYADGEDTKLLLITGAPGSGKSALLAYFAKQYAVNHPETFLLPHFIGISPGSTDIRRTLFRLCAEIARYNQSVENIPEEFDDLCKLFWKLLDQIAFRGNALLILDALDQLDENYHAHSLDWLPHALPQGLRIIVSSLEGDCPDALRCREPAPYEMTVGSLKTEDRKEIVRRALWVYHKRLDERPTNNQMGLMLSKAESDNPLYLIVTCEEMRLFGEFERVSERINALADDIAGLFEQVLERLERDQGEDLVSRALSLLGCSRHGLLEIELLDLLARAGEEQLPRAIWARLYRGLQFYLRPAGETGEGALDFFHKQLALAVRNRYLSPEEKEIIGHRQLSEYYQRKADPTGSARWEGNYPRPLIELPFHQALGHSWKQLAATLTDINFFNAAIQQGHGRNIVDEYINCTRLMNNHSGDSALAELIAVSFAALYGASIPLRSDLQSKRSLQGAIFDVENASSISSDPLASITASAAALALVSISSPQSKKFLELAEELSDKSDLTIEYCSVVAALAVAADALGKNEAARIAAKAVEQLLFIDHSHSRWREAGRVAAILSMGGPTLATASSHALESILDPVGDLEIEQSFRVAFWRYGLEGALQFVEGQQRQVYDESVETISKFQAKIATFSERAKTVAKAIALARELCDEALVAAFLELAVQVCERLGHEGKTALEYAETAALDNNIGLDRVSHSATQHTGSITDRFQALRNVNLADWHSGTSLQNRSKQVMEFVGLVMATAQVDRQAAEACCHWFRSRWRVNLEGESILEILKPLPETLTDFSRLANKLFQELGDDADLKAKRHDTESYTLRGMLAFARAMTNDDLSGALSIAQHFTYHREQAFAILACAIARHPASERYALYRQAVSYVQNSFIYDAEDLFALILFCEEKNADDDLSLRLLEFVPRLNDFRNLTIVY